MRRHGAVRADELAQGWEHALAATGRTQIVSSRGRAASVLFGCVAFVALGAWLTSVGVAHMVIGLVTMCFFGACAVILMVRLVHPLMMTVTASGLSCGRVEVSWSDVSFVGLAVQHRNQLIALALTPDAAARRDAVEVRGQLWTPDKDGRSRLVHAPHVAFPNLFVDSPEIVLWLETVRYRVTGAAHGAGSEVSS